MNRVAIRHTVEKGYHGDELWSAVNPASGKREFVDPGGEFIPGETIMKFYYCTRLDGYVTVPGAWGVTLQSAGDGYTLETVI
jgi:hypothetical protein